jgi:malate-CoA ligase subunit alpha
MVKRYLRRYPKEKRTMLVGPNRAGIHQPRQVHARPPPGHIYMAGRSGWSPDRARWAMGSFPDEGPQHRGLHQCRHRGDPVNGSSFLDILARFEEDPKQAVMMIGESAVPEAEAACGSRRTCQAGRRVRCRPHAPKGRRMGHAGDHPAFGDTAAEGRDRAVARIVRGAQSADLRPWPRPWRSARPVARS